MACGQAPSAQVSPTLSPAPTATGQPEPTSVATPIPTPTLSPKPTPTPSSEPAPTAVATVNCSGGPGASMVVVDGDFVYDVADPIHPRLVCRADNTILHLLDSTSIAYTTAVAGHVVIIRRDLTTGAESQVAQLRVAAQPSYYYQALWKWDGSLEVYTTTVPRPNGRWLVSIHLRSSAPDTVLFTVDAGPGGLESRWSPRPILAFSPDHAYIAFSDFGFAIYGSNIRIFSVADRRQKFVTAGSSSGGTWIGNDRFIWAAMAQEKTPLGALMQWTPAGGAQLIRSEAWYGATSSSDGLWLAGTLITDYATPRTFIVRDAGRTAFKTGPGSSPGFVTPTVVWYAEEGPDTSGSYQCVEPCDHPTVPDGTIRALNVTTGTDVVVSFRSGEGPRAAGSYISCCATRD
jgi:hypothetical protein